MSRLGNSIEIECRPVIAEGLGRNNMEFDEMTVKGYWGSFWGR